MKNHRRRKTSLSCRRPIEQYVIDRREITSLISGAELFMERLATAEKSGKPAFRKTESQKEKSPKKYQKPAGGKKSGREKTPGTWRLKDGGWEMLRVGSLIRAASKALL